ncbi:uncharacterized protein B0T15DRAFT_494036 [Chaetomium strumarium]|uniref:G-protein coupled receptors family 2 profile 2 domain-containing protein n=1 Tax=Chaetomium strumarium TaxID=1170767 RepID=A0AAJ0GTN2_9PEZI|nr:hypothetical protein B0T15DRAFT_494036 [Chaetomium strumarium]
MRGLSEEEANSIIAIEEACSALSLLGCIFVLMTFALSDAFRQRAINRLVFYATFGNMLTNVATLMTTRYTQNVDSPGCQFQAFLIQVFMQSDAYWALAMAINVYLTFYHKYDARMLRKMEIAYLLCCYGIPFIPGLTFLFVSNQQAGRPYGDAVLWCWLKSEWEVYRIATFYAPVWVAIVIAMTIYVRAGRSIYRKRRRMVNFSSTGTGTVHGAELFPVFPEFSSAFNYKTTEVTQTTEIIQAPVPAAKAGAMPPAPLKDAYSVTISADAQAARELNARASSEGLDIESTAPDTATLHPDPNHDHKDLGSSVSSTGNRAGVTDSTRQNQISIAPTVTATVTATGHHHHHHHHHQDNTRSSRARIRAHHYHESSSHNNATWQYTKCAILFFAVLLITWIPSSGNRVYSLIHRDDMSKPLFFASAFVLPLQGFWNAIIYVVTSWAACKSLWGNLCGIAGGWAHWLRSGRRRRRRMSIAEIVDTRTGARRRMGGGGGGGGEWQGGGGIGMWASRKERKEPESTSMEDLTRDGRAA